MSTPVSGTINWTTPVKINSGDIVTAADLNNLNTDVAWLHARPWTIVNQTASGTSIAATGTQVLFGGSGSGTYSITNSSTGAGGSTISISAGAFSVPIAGMYRITASASALATNSAHWRVRIVGQNSSGAAQWIYTGNLVDGYSASGTVPTQTSSVTVLMPIGTSASAVPFGNATSIYAQIENFSGAAIVILGTNSVTPIYPTTLQIEFTGSSTGAY